MIKWRLSYVVSNVVVSIEIAMRMCTVLIC